MTRICKAGVESRPLSLDEVSQIGVFPVESQTSHGYLVVIWQAPDQGAREAFLRSCETEIRAAFTSMGVGAKLESGFWVTVPQVPFELMTGFRAEFKFIQVHQKREVGVAFFPTDRPLPKAQAANETMGMYSIGLDDIVTNYPVTFKAYLHLQKNQKYFLYLRNGRQLQPEQKERLKGNKVSDLFMKSVDIENFRQFLAAAYLYGVVQEASENAA